VNGLLTGSVQIIYAANVTVNPLVAGGKVRALARAGERSERPHRLLVSLRARLDGRNSNARGGRRASQPRRHVGLARACGADGNARAGHRQDPAEGVAQILYDPAMREKSKRTGAFPITSTPKQFSRFIRNEADR
jgi:hypothetical protein